jgi:hypothetical protein
LMSIFSHWVSKRYACQPSEVIILATIYSSVPCTNPSILAVKDPQSPTTPYKNIRYAPWVYKQSAHIQTYLHNTIRQPKKLS